MHTPTFSVDWTSHHFQDWARWLGHLAGQPITGAEIGCFEGRGTVWFCEHLLTHPSSRLYAVDPWGYADEEALLHGVSTRIAAEFDWEAVFARWLENTSPWYPQLEIYRQPSRLAIPKFPSLVWVSAVDATSHRHEDWLEKRPLDFAYVDGSHLACAALEDAVLLWPHLLPGGVLIWDDYDWPLDRQPLPGWPVELLTPRLGIDAFLTVYAGQFDEFEHSNWQIKIRKK